MIGLRRGRKEVVSDPDDVSGRDVLEEPIAELR
jgi:hypothetical protein